MHNNAPAADMSASPADGNRVNPEDNKYGGRPFIEACRRIGEKAFMTSREQEILEQLALGRTTNSISRYLFISAATVRTHTHNIYAKLDVHSREELVALIEEEYRR